MALIKCRECSALISTKAETCPSCGAKSKKKTSLLTWIVGGCFAFVVFNFVSNSVSNSNNSVVTTKLTPEEIELSEQARQRQLEILSAKQSITERMKDPESTRFGEVINRAGFVCGYVNSKNSFGGYTGEKAFVFNISSREIFLQDQGPGFEKLWNSRCPAR